MGSRKVSFITLRDELLLPFQKSLTSAERRALDNAIEEIASVALKFKRLPKESRIAPDEAAYATQVLSELAQVDKLFQNPKAKGRTIEAVMKEVDPLVT